MTDTHPLTIEGWLAGCRWTRTLTTRSSGWWWICICRWLSQKAKTYGSVFVIVLQRAGTRRGIAATACHVTFVSPPSSTSGQLTIMSLRAHITYCIIWRHLLPFITNFLLYTIRSRLMAIPVHVFGVNYLPGFPLIHSVCLVEGYVNIYSSLKRPISLEVVSFLIIRAK